jgi:hypothetical protein
VTLWEVTLRRPRVKVGVGTTIPAGEPQYVLSDCDGCDGGDTDHTWHHIAFVYDVDAVPPLQLFHNGELAKQLNFAEPSPPWTEEAGLGLGHIVAL